MNAPAKIAAATSPDYHADGYGWAMAQSALMRAGAIDQLDWANIIEEIESVGKSERRAVESHLYQVALHLLKWDGQPERRGNSWWHSIQNHRDHARHELAKNPSLKRELDEIVRDAVALAKGRVSRETKLPASSFVDLDYDRAALLDRVIERPPSR